MDADELSEVLRALLRMIPEGAFEIGPLKAATRKRLRADVLGAIERLEYVAAELDPVRRPAHVFDPSDPQTIGRLIAETLLVQERHALESLPRFYGSGVYALYYKGAFDAYLPLSGTETPIYVGKADPAIHGATTPVEQGDRLWGRLRDHRRSLQAVTREGNISGAEFECRYLVVKSAWQATAERFLIEWFRPIWNNEVGICYGFGKHGDKAETRTNTRSPWDTLHPGRAWATREANVAYPLSVEQIKAQIGEHFLEHPPDQPPSQRARARE